MCNVPLRQTGLPDAASPDSTLFLSYLSGALDMDGSPLMVSSQLECNATVTCGHCFVHVGRNSRRTTELFKVGVLVINGEHCGNPEHVWLLAVS